MPNGIKQKIIIFFLISLLLIINSCSFFSPYPENNDCPKGDNGKCIGIDKAYKISKDNNKQQEVEIINVKKITINESENEFNKLKYKKMRELLQKTNKPRLAEAETTAILILPYIDKNAYFSSRTVYVINKNPSWLMIK